MTLGNRRGTGYEITPAPGRSGIPLAAATTDEFGGHGAGPGLRKDHGRQERVYGPTAPPLLQKQHVSHEFVRQRASIRCVEDLEQSPVTVREDAEVPGGRSQGLRLTDGTQLANEALQRHTEPIRHASNVDLAVWMGTDPHVGTHAPEARRDQVGPDRLTLCGGRRATNGDDKPTTIPAHSSCHVFGVDRCQEDPTIGAQGPVRAPAGPAGHEEPLAGRTRQRLTRGLLTHPELRKRQEQGRRPDRPCFRSDELRKDRQQQGLGTHLSAGHSASRRPTSMRLLNTFLKIMEE
jgi:hypothetical protein